MGTAGKIPERSDYDVIEKKTGYKTLFPSFPAGMVIWVCPECQKKLEHHVGQIRAILGIADVVVGNCLGEPIRPNVDVVQLEQLFKELDKGEC